MHAEEGHRTVLQCLEIRSCEVTVVKELGQEELCPVLPPAFTCVLHAQSVALPAGRR